MRHTWWCRTALVALAAALVPATLAAQGRGRGHQKEWEDRDENQNAQPARPYFSPRDRQIIIDYFRGGYGNLPPGLAKRGGNLPPGLERQLRRNGHLPPGLEKRLVPFPVDLERRLPRLPSVYQRVILGPDVLIVNRKTGAVLDILRGVIALSQP